MPSSSSLSSTFGVGVGGPGERAMPAISSLTQPVKFKLAARRWRNFTYGRLRRAPKLPVKQQQSSESSSAASTEDLSEDSSSGVDDDEEAAGLEYEMDSKDLCIEIKLAKDQQHPGGAKSKYDYQSESRQHLVCNLDMRRSSLSGLLGGSKSANHLAASDPGGGGDGGAGKKASGGSATQDAAAAASSWMRWDNERSTRANQDHQREIECSLFRTMVKHLRYKQHINVGDKELP